MDTKLIFIVFIINLVNVNQCDESPIPILINAPYELPYNVFQNTISANMSPIIVQRPEYNSLAVVTQTALLLCPVFGFPKPVVKWEKDGNQLTGDRYEVLESGDLRIYGVLISDVGDYKCCATNGLGEVNAYTHLVVKDNTRITELPQNLKVAAHQMAVFRCNVEFDYTLDLRIEWLFNGNEIDYDNFPRILQEHKEWTPRAYLNITEAKESDSGVYTCVATTPLDSVRAEANLTIDGVLTKEYSIFSKIISWFG